MAVAYGMAPLSNFEMSGDILALEDDQWIRVSKWPRSGEE